MKLRDLDPAGVGDRAHQAVVDQILKLHGAIETAGDPSPILAAVASRPSEIRRVAHLLAHYAKTGEPPEGREELVEEYLISLLPSGLVESIDDPLAGRRDPETEIELVVLAVLGRQALAARRPLGDAQLAALAGLSASRVRQLAASGELRRVEGGISSTDARRWLDSRG